MSVKNKVKKGVAKHKELDQLVPEMKPEERREAFRFAVSMIEKRRGR